MGDLESPYLNLAPVVAACILMCSPASAQERPGSVHLQAGVAVAHQAGPSGEAFQTYVAAPGGTTQGWLVGGGVAVARHMSIDAEWSSTGTMVAREPSRYSMTFNEERRDRFVTVALRFAVPIFPGVRIEPVGGVVVTFPQAWFQTEYVRYPGTPQEAVVLDPRQQHRLDRSLGPALGCDLRLGGGRVALVPSFRAARTAVSHGVYSEGAAPREIGAIYPGGYPKWTFRAGVAVRVQAR